MSTLCTVWCLLSWWYSGIMLMYSLHDSWRRTLLMNQKRENDSVRNILLWTISMWEELGVFRVIGGSRPLLPWMEAGPTCLRILGVVKILWLSPWSERGQRQPQAPYCSLAETLHLKTVRGNLEGVKILLIGKDDQISLHLLPDQCATYFFPLCCYFP